MRAAESFGKKLYDAVFRDEVRECLTSSLHQVDREEISGLRIKLRLVDVPELANLPWEYLYHPTLRRFIVLSSETPITRYVNLPRPVMPLRITGPLHLLVMVASPSDYQPLDVNREKTKLENALSDLEQRGLIVIEWLENHTLAALQQRLRWGPVHLFHFIGHGGWDEQAQDGVLLFENESGRGYRVNASRLAAILHDHRALKLVVLNTCEGARLAPTDPFAGVATTLIQQGIPAVLAMQFEITDQAAILLAQVFYESLADGYPAEAALSEARKAIFASSNDVEWGTPVLYLRTPNGRLFDLTTVQPSQGAEYLAAQKVEAERLAREKAEQERLTQDAQKAEAEPIAKAKAEQEQLARQKAEAERAAQKRKIFTRDRIFSGLIALGVLAALSIIGIFGNNAVSISATQTAMAVTVSPSSTPSLMATRTAPAILTETRTVTVVTATETPSPTLTKTPTTTPTSTSTPTETPSLTPTNTSTPTKTRSPSPTIKSPTPRSPTPVPESGTFTPTPTWTRTPTPTSTHMLTSIIPPTKTPPGNKIGRVLFTTNLGNLYLYSIDPAGGTPTQLGQTDQAHSTCNSSATVATADNQVISVYRGPYCALGRLGECRSPDGRWLATYSAKGRSDGSGTIVTSPSNDESQISFVVDGMVNASKGILWSPNSSGFIFYIGGNFHFAMPGQDGFRPVGAGEVISWAPDSTMLLIKEINDIGVQHLDGRRQLLINGQLVSNIQCPVWSGGP